MIRRAVVMPGAPLLVPGITGRPVALVEQLRAQIAAALDVFADGESVAVVGVAGDGPAGVFRPDACDAVGGFGGLQRAPRRPCDGATPTPRPVVPAHLGVGRTVIAHLRPDLQIASLMALPQTGPATDAVPPVGNVIVLGEGSTMRGPKPPRGTHPDAAAFDEDVATALRDGDAEGLVELCDSSSSRRRPVQADTTAAFAWLGTLVRALSRPIVTGAGTPSHSALASAHGAAAGVVVDPAAAGPDVARVHASLLYHQAPWGVGYFVATWIIPDA